MPITHIESPVLAFDFELATRSVLRFLQARLGFDLVMVSKTDGKQWIVLQSEDRGYGVAPGATFHWNDMICSRMIAGVGPRIAADCSLVPAYAGAPICEDYEIAAYLGVPLRYSDGSIFGTISALNSTPKPVEIETELPMVELVADLLGSVLQNELNANESIRRAEKAEALIYQDPLTELYNRRGWNRLLMAEDVRCARYGCAACVVVVDLDGLTAINESLGREAGDAIIRLTAQVIRETTRSSDVVARLGGDEFAVLGIECSRDGSLELSRRIKDGLERVGIEASVGFAPRIPSKRLQDAWIDADHAMYREKNVKNSRAERVPILSRHVLISHDAAAYAGQ
jgi:diguanylate cyclase (GGDEF)-like protein